MHWFIALVCNELLDVQGWYTVGATSHTAGKRHCLLRPRGERKKTCLHAILVRQYVSVSEQTKLSTALGSPSSRSAPEQ